MVWPFHTETWLAQDMLAFGKKIQSESTLQSHVKIDSTISINFRLLTAMVKVDQANLGHSGIWPSLSYIVGVAEVTLVCRCNNIVGGSVPIDEP